jgi:hypothetical protein
MDVICRWEYRRIGRCYRRAAMRPPLLAASQSVWVGCMGHALTSADPRQQVQYPTKPRTRRVSRVEATMTLSAIEYLYRPITGMSN